MVKKYSLLKSVCFLLLLWVLPSYGYACRCAGFISPAVAYQRADVVLWGKVLAVKGDINTEQGAIAKISVLKLWKKSVGKEVEVLTRTTCAYDFKIGDEYLLFLNKTADIKFFTTGICSGNLQITNAEKAFNWLKLHAKLIDIDSP